MNYPSASSGASCPPTGVGGWWTVGPTWPVEGYLKSGEGLRLG